MANSRNLKITERLRCVSYTGMTYRYKISRLRKDCEVCFIHRQILEISSLQKAWRLAKMGGGGNRDVRLEAAKMRGGWDGTVQS
jgi:hypothetical protein